MKKRIFALILAVLMITALAVPCFAAEETTGLEGHIYHAFQIFKGTQAKGEAKLANIEWGDGINSEKLLAALSADSAFANCKTAEDVARVVSTFGEDSDEARAFAKLCCHNKIGDGIPVKNGDILDAGYYLVADYTGVEEGKMPDLINLSLLQLTNKGSFVITEKVSVPKVEKEVYEETVNGWQEAADYKIGASVPFRVTATIGEVRSFKCYELIFHDTLSAGLTFDEEAPVSVTIVRKGVLFKTIPENDINGYKLDVKADRYIDLKIIDLVPYGIQKDDEIIFTYNAILNKNAEVGVEGNPNEVYLEFTNNPNDDCGKTTGNTPTSEVKVYTWGLNVDKVTTVGGQTKPLPGAKFTLYRKNANGSRTSLGEKEVEQVVDDEGNISYTAIFSGLDSGTYVLSETKTPAGYNGIADIEFTVIAIFDGEEVKSFNVNKDFAVKDGIMTAEIMNKVGLVLPETGGEGTKALTAIGAVMALCGMVCYITKKHVGNADD